MTNGQNTNVKQYYLGNQNLKAINLPVEFTKDNIEEYVKCSTDPIYFITKYVKVISLDFGIVPFDLYDYQVEFIESIHNSNRVIGMFPRQFGKCISLNSNVKLKQKSTGKMVEVTIGEFYAWRHFLSYGTVEDLQKMQQRIKELPPQ